MVAEAGSREEISDRFTWWQVIPFIGAATVVAGTVVYVFTGYLFGYSDHTLLMLKGISWADPTALVGDWFNDRAPQPHWLFDIITYIGLRLGRLPAVYFVYWLATLAVFGLGTAYLAERWLPRGRRAIAIGAVLLAAAGPKFAFGQFLILEGQALPNLLGGALAFATVAALLTARDLEAIVLALLTGIVHVQHGTAVAGVLGLTAVLSNASLRTRVLQGVTAAMLLAMTLIVASVRGLTAGSRDVVEICNQASPGHCDASSWGWVVVRDGLLILACVGAVALWKRRAWRVVVPVLVVPLAVVLSGFWVDRMDVAVLGELSQRLFPYRAMAFLAPFAVWLVVLLAGGRDQQMMRALARTAGACLVSGLYLTRQFSITAYAVESHFNLWILGILIGGLLSVPMLVESISRRATKDRVELVASRPIGASLVTALAVLVVVHLGFRVMNPPSLHLGYRPEDGRVPLGALIRDATPPGSVIAHPPDLDWVRLTSHRAVVGNCKAIPYGGEPWIEYQERMAALGVEPPYWLCAESRPAFEALAPSDIVALRDRYGATHVLLFGFDPKIEYATEHWETVWALPEHHWWFFSIPEG